MSRYYEGISPQQLIFINRCVTLLLATGYVSARLLLAQALHNVRGIQVPARNIHDNEYTNQAMS